MSPFSTRMTINTASSANQPSRPAANRFVIVVIETPAPREIGNTSPHSCNEQIIAPQRPVVAIDACASGAGRRGEIRKPQAAGRASLSGHETDLECRGYVFPTAIEVPLPADI